LGVFGGLEAAADVVSELGGPIIFAVLPGLMCAVKHVEKVFLRRGRKLIYAAFSRFHRSFVAVDDRTAAVPAIHEQRYCKEKQCGDSYGE